MNAYVRYGIALGLISAAWLTDARLARADPKDVSPQTDADYAAVLDQAVEAFDRHDYGRARTLFEKAHALRANARVLRGLGLSALQLRRFTQAKQELTAALSDTRQPLTQAQRESVAALLAWMETDLATLRLRLKPSNSQITLDGEPALATEFVLEPGAHQLRVTSEGYEAESRALELSAGEDRTLDIALLALIPPTPPPPPISTATKPADARRNEQRSSPQHDPNPPQSSTVLERWWFWTAVGVLIAGGVATAVALTAKEPEPAYEQHGLGGVMMPLGRLP
ncbi:MAG TPA: PEGA domain-containing protein [Polyangiales bacterium]|nr:PEGA domain-containing protein [Polyangiales bacterium]